MWMVLLFCIVFVGVSVVKILWITSLLTTLLLEWCWLQLEVLVHACVFWFVSVCLCAPT